MMQDSYRKRRNYSHYFRTGCDYYLNERTVWGVSLGGNFSRQRENAGMFTEIRETGVAGNTYSHAEQNRNNVSAGTSMVHKLKREGGELSASFDYFHYYPIVFKPLGCCCADYCVNSSHFLSLGVIPQISTPS